MDKSQETEEGNQEEQKTCTECNNILIIDDNVFNVLSLQLILGVIKTEESKLTSDTANNGLEGLEKIQSKLLKCCRKPYKIVFVDLNMPVMGGYEMMKEI